MRSFALSTCVFALACATPKPIATVSIAPPSIAPRAPRLECSPRDPNACHTLARRALARDPRHAFMFESTACEHGVVAACGGLGWMMLHGTWGEADARAAFDLLDGACRAGFVASCVDVGVLERVVHRDDVKASAIFGRYCDRDVAAACDELGRMVESGEGFAPDAAAAKRLYEHACHEGSAAGCGDLGRVNGDLAMLQSACRRHDGRACFELARIDAHDKTDHDERACNLGVAEGCFALATDAPKDSPQESWWLSRACDERNAYACDLLGWHIGSPALHARARALEK
jgi:TPR repeat protein